MTTNRLVLRLVPVTWPKLELQVCRTNNDHAIWWQQYAPDDGD